MMETILVPTDFSKISQNAINYAFEIAKLAKAKLILFHVYQLPIVTGEVTIVLPNDAERENDCLVILEQVKAKLLHTFDKQIEIECVCRGGIAVDEIEKYAGKNRIDLIVMGMHGAGYLKQKLFGSVTTSLISKAKCPVLAIHKGVKFRNIKRIVFACDFKDIKARKILAPLKEFVHLFGARVFVLNVVPELTSVIRSGQTTKDLLKLEHLINDMAHSFHYSLSEDVVEGINEFVIEKKMDMVVMIPRQHTVVEKVLKEPYTRRMAFHSSVPLLALH